MVNAFRLAIFLGAGLLFVIQPMFAKTVLPMLGGSPAVWNTCMLFFQGMLLAGYAYAHLSQRLFGTRTQVIVHLVLLAAIIFLPAMTISGDWIPPADDSPIFWLLGLLLVVVGGPFFAVSATSPLLQQWFAATNHERSGNPYFLYAASNAGSMLALLAYPFVIERIWSLDVQAWIWKYTYFAFAGSMVLCAWFVFRSSRSFQGSSVDASGLDSTTSDDLDKNSDEFMRKNENSWQQKLLWVGLAFVPSSWMLGVTSFLTTDITPMPILWIIPLSLYLITFIIAFSEKPILSSNWMMHLFPIAMLILVATTILKAGFSILMIHLFIFFVGAMMCHFELARRKPSTRHLTEFYLWVSVGGLLGGVFNGLIAPLAFPWILEYPLTLMLACMLCPSFSPIRLDKKIEQQNLKSKKKTEDDFKKKKKRKKKDQQPEPADEDEFEKQSRMIKLRGIVAFALLMALLANILGFQGTPTLILTTMFGLALLCVLFVIDKPLWFAVPLGAVLILAKLEPPQPGEKVLYTGRGFFGVNRVVDGPNGGQRRLYHGTTVHGIQNTNPETPELNLEPMTYYHRTGPLGMIFEAAQKQKKFDKVGIIGLGAGTAAAYLQPGQHFVFFEIDPIVKQIAEDPRYFTFLEKCGSENYDIVLGDGRLKLASDQDESFDLLVLDAFSSDAIPIHLMTREAVEMYVSKLGTDGFMAFHISNLHFDLEPVLGDIAAELGLDSLTWHDRNITDEEMIEGKAPASYVVIGKDLKRTGLANRPQWKKTKRSGRKRVWTDQFSNLFDAMK